MLCYSYLEPRGSEQAREDKNLPVDFIIERPHKCAESCPDSLDAH